MLERIIAKKCNTSSLISAVWIPPYKFPVTIKCVKTEGFSLVSDNTHPFVKIERIVSTIGYFIAIYSFYGHNNVSNYHSRIKLRFPHSPKLVFW